MLHFLPGPVRALLGFVFLILNTLVWCFLLFFAALLKLILPFPPWRRACTRVINHIAGTWILFNNLNMKLLHRITWEVEGLENLENHRWYLVLCNHQSWVDIIVLQKIFHGRIPFLKFFLKKELIWIPVLGMAWWALDFPFMKRYSRRFIEKNPHLKGQDLEITRKACGKFKEIPVSIMNFVEGTRFTPEKHRRQESPYANLLRPKAGGIAFVLSAMGEYLDRIVDVTIVYPDGRKSFWDLLCGRIRNIRVNVSTHPVDTGLLREYFTSDRHREPFHRWVNDIWQDKDRAFDRLLESPDTASGP